VSNVSSLVITTRRARSGNRYVVRFRLGGRAYPLVHGGSFKTLKDAKARRDLIGGEIANGRNPADLLRILTTPTPVARSLRQWGDAYRASRVDVGDATKEGYAKHLAAVPDLFLDRDPAALGVADMQELVGTLSKHLKPASVAKYMTTVRLVLDFAGVDPNPSRDSRVKLPAIEREEPVPPTAAQLLAMLEKIPRRWRLPLILIEQCGLRVGEAHELAWGDVDETGLRLRLRAASTKGKRGRWVQVPEWLMALLSDLCPLDDRTAERRVFPAFSADVAKNVMARGCVAAKIPHFHPHDLRHRRVSLWHGQGVPWRELADRVGHSRASMTLDVYSHVMPLDEVGADDFLPLLSERKDSDV
jgi:integrase